MTGPAPLRRGRGFPLGARQVAVRLAELLRRAEARTRAARDEAADALAAREAVQHLGDPTIGRAALLAEVATAPR
ncbi:hypothetical protein P3T27_007806 [Kitasatospora sp. MAA19]|nr:hypothetical protein [Kitasatospora sp. MAA19]